MNALSATSSSALAGDSRPSRLIGLPSTASQRALSAQLNTSRVAGSQAQRRLPASSTRGLSSDGSDGLTRRVRTALTIVGGSWSQGRGRDASTVAGRM